MIDIAVLTSVGVLGAALFVVLILRRRASLGSAALGLFCGLLISTGWRVGPALANLITGGINGAATWLREAVGGLSIHGFVPASVIPAWGWRVLVICVAFTAIGIVVVFLDGGRGKGKSKAAAS